MTRSQLRRDAKAKRRWLDADHLGDATRKKRLTAREMGLGVVGGTLPTWALPQHQKNELTDILGENGRLLRLDSNRHHVNRSNL